MKSHSKFIVLIAILSGVTLFACKEDEKTNISQSPADTTAPTVVSVFPSAGSTDVQIDTAISVAFSEIMNPSSVTSNSTDTTCTGSIQVSSNDFVDCVRVSDPTSDNDVQVFTAQPTSVLGFETKYKIKVTTEVADYSGNSLEAEYVFTDGFTTVLESTSDSTTDTTSDTPPAPIDSTPWHRQSGSADSEMLRGMTVDQSGNVYVVGNWGNNSTLPVQIAFYKYSSNGDLGWTKIFGSGWAEGVVVDSEGDVYITGYTNIAMDGNTHKGNMDVFISKYDASGTLQWTKQPGTSANEQAHAIAIDNNDNIIVTGYTYGELDGNTYQGNADIFVTKYSSEGGWIWTRQLGTTALDWGMAICTDSNGDVYISGQTAGELDGNTFYGDTMEGDIFVTKYSSSGIKQWTRQHGTTTGEGGRGMTTDSSNNVYVTGFTKGDLDGNTNTGGNDTFAMKFESSGVHQWTILPGGDQGMGISIDNLGFIYLTGHLIGGTTLYGETAQGGGDAFILKYDSSMVFQWVKLAGSLNGSETPFEIVLDQSRNVYIAGGTSGELSGYTNQGSSDLLIMKNPSGISP